MNINAHRNRLGIRLQGPKPEFARDSGGEGGSHPSNVHDHVYALGTINYTGRPSSSLHFHRKVLLLLDIRHWYISILIIISMQQGLYQDLLILLMRHWQLTPSSCTERFHWRVALMITLVRLYSRLAPLSCHAITFWVKSERTRDEKNKKEKEKNVSFKEKCDCRWHASGANVWWTQPGRICLSCHNHKQPALENGPSLR